MICPLASFQGLLLIDETDALQDAKDKRKLAELIKLLSDSGSPFKLMVVGIAETAQELTDAHPSVQRCLKETKLQRMSDDELAAIITQGSQKLKLNFDDQVTRAIVNLSSGYPHFTHLLALKCAEEAIAGNRRSIVKADLKSAMSLAVEDAEGTLRRQYDDAIRSHSTTMYEDILCAAVAINQEEFTAGQLRNKLNMDKKENYTQPGLNNFLKHLVSDDGRTILIRKAKGVYKFVDPRMPSYVRIANKQL